MTSSLDGAPLNSEEEFIRDLTKENISEILSTNSTFATIFPAEEKNRICDAILNLSLFIDKIRGILSPNPSFPKRQMKAFFEIIDETLKVSEDIKAKKAPLDSLIDLYHKKLTDITRVCCHFNPEHLADYFFGKNEVISMMKTSTTMHEKSLKAYLDKRRDAKIIIKNVISKKQLSDVDMLLANLKEMFETAKQFFECTENYGDENKEKLQIIFNDMERKIIQLRAFIILEKISKDVSQIVVGDPDPIITEIKETTQIPEPINALFSSARNPEDVKRVYEEFRKKHKLMMGHRIVDIYLEMCRLSLLSNRLEILLTNGVSSFDMREFFTKINSLLIKYFNIDNEFITSSDAHDFRQISEELAKNVSMIDFGSHTTKAFSKSDIIKVCLTKLSLLFTDIENCLNFVQQIGATMENPIKPILSISVIPSLRKVDKAKFGLISMKNVDQNASNILHFLQSRLPTNGINDNCGDGYHFSEEDLIIPDISNEIAVLKNLMKSEEFYQLFNNNFYFSLQDIISGPSQEVTVRKTLYECSRVFFVNEFANGEQPLEVLDALTSIHNSYIWIAALNYYNIIDFTAGLHMMYARTFAHLVLNEDLMSNSKLSQTLNDFPEVAARIEEIDCQMESEKSRESISVLRENFPTIISKLFASTDEEEIKKLSSLTEWMLNAEANHIVECPAEILSIELENPQLKDAIKDLSERASFNTRMEHAIFYLKDIFNEEPMQRSDVSDLISFVVNCSEKLVKEGLLIVPSSMNIAELNPDNFLDFRLSFLLKMGNITSSIHVKVREILTELKTEGESIFIEFDRLIRGSLCPYSLCSFIKDISLAKSSNEELISGLKSNTETLVTTWRFMNCIDNISDALCDDPLTSVVRVYNMTQFLAFYTNQVLYLNTSIVSISSTSEEPIVPINVRESALNIRRMLRKVQEEKDEISFGVCREIRHIESEFMKLDQTIFIKKARQILVHTTTLLSEDQVVPVFELIDDIIVNGNCGKEKLLELHSAVFDCLNESLPQFLLMITSTLNTSLILKSLYEDTCSFFSFIETKGKEVPLCEPLIIFNHIGENETYKHPTLPLQVGIEKQNEDFINFFFTSQIGAAAALISDSSITQEYQIAPPQKLLSVEEQNAIASILIEEQNTHKNLSKEGTISSGDPNVAALTELSVLKNSVQEAEVRQLELKEKLKSSISKWKGDLRTLVKLHEAANEEVDNIKSDLTEYAGFNEKRDAILSRVNRKKKEVERLKAKLSSYVNFSSFSSTLYLENQKHQEELKNREKEYINSISENMKPINELKESMCEYVPPKKEASLKKERAPSPPKMGKIPPSISQYCHIDGLYPMTTKRAVEIEVEEMRRMGDSKELMKKFNETNHGKDALSKVSKASKFASANNVEKNSDLQRRISLLNDILSRN